MKVYLVTNADMILLFKRGLLHPGEVKGNHLITFSVKTVINNMDLIKSISNNIIVDSGAFSFQTGANKSKPDFDEYVKDYVKWIKHNDDNLIQGYFEFDIDQIIGYNKVKYYREQLEEVTDKIIPVWHHTLGIPEFKKMCNDYEYISVSCVKNKDIQPEQLPLFVNYAHRNGCKIHALGMTRKKVLDKLPFDSVDSSSWIKTVRFGTYNGKKVNSDFIRNKHSDLVLMDYLQNIKFQEHYYNKWQSFHND